MFMLLETKRTGRKICRLKVEGLFDKGLVKKKGEKGKNKNRKPSDCSCIDL